MSPAAAHLVLRALRLEPWRPRAMLLAAGVALGVSVLVALATVEAAAVRLFQSAVAPRAGSAAIRVGGVAPGLPAGMVARLAADPDVAATVPFVRRGVRAADDDALLDLVGLDLLDADGLHRLGGSGGPEVVLAGDPLLVLADPDAVLVTDALAVRRGLDPGARLAIRTPTGVRTLTVHGILRRSGDVLGATSMVMDLQAAQTVFGCRGCLDGVDLVLRDGVDPVAAAERLGRMVAPAVLVDARGAGAAVVDHVVRAFRTIVDAAAVLALVLGALLVHGVVGNAVVVRRRTIALVRLLGARRRDVVLVVLASVFVAAIAGALAGAAFGYGAAGLLCDTVVRGLGLGAAVTLDASAARLDPTRIPAGVAVGVVAALLGAVGPVARVLQAPIGSAVADGLVAPTSGERRRSGPAVRALGCAAFAGACGLACGAAGLPFGARAFVTLGLLVAAGAPWVAVALDLWRRALRRGLPRCGARGALLAAGIGAAPGARTRVLLVGIGLGVAVFVILAALDASVARSVTALVGAQLRGDLVVTAREPEGVFDTAPLPVAAEEAVAGLAGVARVVSMRVAMIRYAGVPLRVRAIGGAADDRARLASLLLAGDPTEALAALGDADAVLASRNFVRRFGLRLGATISLATPGGPHAFRIAGIVADIGSRNGALTLGRPAYRRLWRDDRVNALEVHLAPAARADDVARRLRDGPGRTFDLHVRSPAAFREETNARVHGAFAFLRTVEVASLAVTLLALVDDLLATAIERRGELAALRALGATGRQVGAMLVGEAVLLALGGTIAGVGWGVVVARGWLAAHLEELVGFAVAFHVPTAAIARAVAAIGGVAVVAALAPVALQVRTRVTEVLRGPA